MRSKRRVLRKENLIAKNTNSQMVLVIPAYRPNNVLLCMLERLFNIWKYPIILVNDGSERAYDHIFQKAEQMGCVVKKHAKNLGKGRALKTAFKECMNSYPGFVGAVTADADGQHAPEDIVACGNALIENPDKLVLGCRTFDRRTMPMHNYLGNRIFAFSMRLMFGIKVNDAQTGLRGIPRAFMEKLLDVPGDRYELESNMLVEAKKDGYEFQEVPIQTIYMDESAYQGCEDERSHFHVVKDSLSIYVQLFKYALSSMASTVVDLALFSMLVAIFESIGLVSASVAIATVLARCVAGVVNFSINRKAVFQSKDSMAGEALRYAVLFVTVMCASALLVSSISDFFALSPVAVKVFVDIALFFVNYRVQRSWVFKGRNAGAKGAENA